MSCHLIQVKKQLQELWEKFWPREVTLCIFCGTFEKRYFFNMLWNNRIGLKYSHKPILSTKFVWSKIFILWFFNKLCTLCIFFPMEVTNSCTLSWREVLRLSDIILCGYLIYPWIDALGISSWSSLCSWFTICIQCRTKSYHVHHLHWWQAIIVAVAAGTWCKAGLFWEYPHKK